MQDLEILNAKKELANLYLLTKLQKKDSVSQLLNIYNNSSKYYQIMKMK